MSACRRAWTQLRPRWSSQLKQQQHRSIVLYHQQRSLHRCTSLLSGKERRSGDKSTNDKREHKEERLGQLHHKLTAKEKDDIIMARMKARMSLEGDEPYEDGQPADSGLRGNVKRNMFRVI